MLEVSRQQTRLARQREHWHPPFAWQRARMRLVVLRRLSNPKHGKREFPLTRCLYHIWPDVFLVACDEEYARTGSVRQDMYSLVQWTCSPERHDSTDVEERDSND